MFYRMLQKANYLITQYEIFDFPIPIHVIESLIFDRRIKVQILDNITTGCIIADNILLPRSSSASLRENMIHEYSHARYHVHNHFSSDRIQIAKNEAQAKAFAAYFLMPVYIFEESLKYCEDDYELSEEYGVTQEFLEYRKMLSRSLMLAGYFDADIHMELKEGDENGTCQEEL